MERHPCKPEDASLPERAYMIDGHTMSAPGVPAGLYVVATPIGNRADITLRALATLAAVDMVAAEDTRHTGRFLSHYAITTQLVRYDEHGAAAQRPKLLAALGEGQSIALVSDAGTPLVSDPGYRLVAEAWANGHSVRVVPGASAPIAALSVSGLPTDRFHFAGFLPSKAAARDKRILDLAGIPATLVLFEAPHRLAATLESLSKALGPRQAVVARELTKRFETVERDTLDRLAARFAQTPTKGEIVVLVAPPGDAAAPTDDEVDALLAAAQEGKGAAEAAAEVAKATGLPRRDLYKRILALRKHESG
ncbi:MAG: 16S rRNA (cytidine(1402)-2'-O)-methyltransferase [Pseudomonadota bacterium]